MAQKPKLLTDRAIAALKPSTSGKRVMLYDGGAGSVPGFAVMVTPTVKKPDGTVSGGARSYILSARYPRTGKPARRFIAKVGALSLAKARAKAAEWRELISEGKDPAEVEAARKRAAARQRADNFETVAKRYIERYVKGPERERGPMRTAADTEYIINRHLVPRWGTRPISSITSHDVEDLCADFEKTGVVAHGRNTFAVCRGLFKWALAKRYEGLERNPCDGLHPIALIGAVQARARVLDDIELQAFWKATDILGWPYREMLRLALLTGCRRDEIAEARKAEFDLEARTWTIPSERFKSNPVHILPLSDQAVAILKGMPEFEGPYLFSINGGKKPVNGFSKTKLRLDGAMQGILGDRKLAPWVLHDLRRTCRSRLSELRIDPIVAEAVLGHSLPVLLGTYDRHRYLGEKRIALQAWAGQSWAASPCSRAHASRFA